MTAVLVIEALAIVLLAVLVVGLLRSHAEILRSLHNLGMTEETVPGRQSGPQPQPRLNSNAPADLAGQTISGSAIHVGVAGTAPQTLLAFLSTTCSACLELWKGLSNESPVPGLGDARLVVVTKGPEAESQSRLEQLAPAGVTVIQTSDAWEAYGVPVTPYFVLVDGPTGRIVGEGSAPSWKQVGSLIVQAVDDREVTERALADDSELRADSELREAGIGPGHASLYPETPPVREES